MKYVLRLYSIPLRKVTDVAYTPTSLTRFEEMKFPKLFTIVITRRVTYLVRIGKLSLFSIKTAVCTYGRRKSKNNIKLLTSLKHAYFHAYFLKLVIASLRQKKKKYRD